MARRIEERFEFPNGIKGEWEPSRIRPVSDREKDTRQQVRDLNRQAKERGDCTRYRSVEEEY